MNNEGGIGSEIEILTSQDPGNRREKRRRMRGKHIPSGDINGREFISGITFSNGNLYVLRSSNYWNHIPFSKGH